LLGELVALASHAAGDPAASLRAVAKRDTRPATELLADLTCILAYEDPEDGAAMGQVSIERVIQRGGSVHLLVFCHTRTMLRRLPLARVTACWDGATGQRIDLGAYVATLGPAPPRPRRKPRWLQWQPGPLALPALPAAAPAAPENGRLGNMIDPLEQRRAERPEVGPGTPMAERCGDGLRVLGFLAVCDGQVHPAERRVMVEYAHRACRGEEIGCPAVPFDPALVDALSGRPALSVGALTAAARRVAAQGPRAAGLLLRCADDLIRADRVLREIEVEGARWLAHVLDDDTAWREAGPLGGPIGAARPDP
jgi:hypothetical protein